MTVSDPLRRSMLFLSELGVLGSTALNALERQLLRLLADLALIS